MKTCCDGSGSTVPAYESRAPSPLSFALIAARYGTSVTRVVIERWCSSVLALSMSAKATDKLDFMLARR